MRVVRARIVTPMTLAEVENIRPHLKVGTVLLPHPNSTYVGRSDQGLEVSSPARSALPNMDGTRTCEELSQCNGIPLSDITALLSELDSAGLIDTEKSKITVHTRFHSPIANRASHDGDDSNDGAVQQLLVRLLPELSFTTWLPTVRDGGVSAVGRRRDWNIVIHGDSRIATLLYGILLSSGVTHTSLFCPDERKRIQEVDMCAGFLHPSDIGLAYKTRTHELARELSLFPMVKDPSGSSESVAGQLKMAIAVGNVPADQMQEWMSEGVPHLLIDSPDTAKISVGPIVIPGQSPCARCVSISLEDQNPTWREITMEKLLKPAIEVPVALAHHIAGVAALEVLRFMDEGQSQLIGGRASIDYHRPTVTTQHSFTRHPACGCNW